MSITLLKQLHSVLILSNPHTIPPPPSLFSFHSQPTIPTQSPSTYRVIKQRIDTQLNKKIVNPQRIKQHALQIYNKISTDIQNLQQLNNKVQQIRKYQNVLKNNENIYIQFVQEIQKQYSHILKQEDQELQMAQSFQGVWTNFVSKVHDQVLPTYQKIFQFSQASTSITLEVPKSQTSESIESLLELLCKLRSILSLQYQSLLSCKPSTQQQSQVSINFLFKISQIFKQIQPYVCTQNCTLIIITFKLNHMLLNLYTQTKHSYHRFILGSDWGYEQCWAQGAKWVYFQSTFEKQMHQIEIKIKQIGELIESLSMIVKQEMLGIQKSSKTLDNYEKEKISEEIDQKSAKCLNFIKGCLRVLTNGKTMYFTSIADIIQNSIINIVLLQTRCQSFLFFIQNWFPIFHTLYLKMNKNQKSISSLSSSGQGQYIDLQINQYQLLLQMQTLQQKLPIQLEFACMKQIVDDTLNRIKTRRIKSAFIEQKSPQTASKIILIQESSQKENSFHSPIKNQMSLSLSPPLSPRPSLVQSNKSQSSPEILSLFSQCAQFFQIQLINYIPNGLELLLLKIEENRKQGHIDKKQRLGKLQKRLDYFEKRVKENWKQTEQVKQPKGPKLLSKSQQSSILNLSINSNQDNPNTELEFIQVNIEAVMKLISVQFSHNNGVSLVRLFEQCVSFERQDWVKRISVLERELKMVEQRTKQISVAYENRLTFFCSSVYRIYKQFITACEILIDVWTQIMLIFKNSKNKEKQRKGNLLKTGLNLFNESDLCFLESMLEYKLKIKEEISEIQKFNALSKNVKTYLKDFLKKFKTSFHDFFPYQTQCIENVIKRMPNAMSFRENHFNIFQTFTEIVQKYSRNASFHSEQFYQICQEIQNLQYELKEILILENTSLPIDPKSIEDLRIIFGMYEQEFSLAEIVCDQSNHNKKAEKQMKIQQKIKKVCGKPFQ